MGTWFSQTICNYGYSYCNYGYEYDFGTGKYYQIPTLGASSIDAWGINNPTTAVPTGQVVGRYWNFTGTTACNFASDAFLDVPGSNSTLVDYNGTGTPAAWSWAHGINDDGQIVGTYGTELVKNGVTYCYSDHGYIYQNGSSTPFDYGGSATQTYFYATNGFGQVVGAYQYSKGGSPSNYAPFIYENSAAKAINVTALAACSGSSDIQALGINNNEQIVGWCLDSSGACRGFLYDYAHPNAPNNPMPINCGGTNTSPSGINDSPAVVGACDSGNFVAR